MGFPVETVDGETVIVEKTPDGQLVAEDGSVYRPHGIDALRVELVEAAEAVQEAVEAVQDAADEVGDVITTTFDSAEDLFDALESSGQEESGGEETAEAPEAA